MALVVIATVLYATGVLFPVARANGPETYSEASSDAMSVAHGIPGGPWDPLAAVGVDSREALSSSLIGGANLTVAGCPTESFVSLSNLPTLPAYGGSIDAGAAPAWIVVLTNGSALVFVLDINRTATAVDEVYAWNVSCPIAGALSVISPLRNVIDSSQAAGDAWIDGGSSFVAGYPSVYVYLTLTPALSIFGASEPATWTIDYRACNATAVSAGALGPSFNASYDAFTGQPLHLDHGNSSCAADGLPAGGLTDYGAANPSAAAFVPLGVRGQWGELCPGVAPTD